MSELKPCPFCGGNNIHLSRKKVTQFSICYYRMAMYCSDCLTYGPRILTETADKNHWLSNSVKIARNSQYEERAIEAWNRRAT